MNTKGPKLDREYSRRGEDLSAGLSTLPRVARATNDEPESDGEVA
jgi:hypothetical protein